MCPPAKTSAASTPPIASGASGAPLITDVQMVNVRKNVPRNSTAYLRTGCLQEVDGAGGRRRSKPGCPGSRRESRCRYRRRRPRLEPSAVRDPYDVGSERAERPAMVADRVLLLRGHRRGGALVVGRIEDRVVAEAGG